MRWNYAVGRLEMVQLMVSACRHHPLLMVFPLPTSRDKTMSSYFSESFLSHFWNISETGEICFWIVSPSRGSQAPTIYQKDKTQSNVLLLLLPETFLKRLWNRGDLCLNCLLRMAFPRTTTNQQRQNNVLLLQEIRIAKGQSFTQNDLFKLNFTTRTMHKFWKKNPPSTDGLPSALV